jgi:hypothetical protein
MDPETEAAVAALHRAIRDKDWDAARQQWGWLLLHHPYLCKSNPHVAAMLRNEEAMVYPHSDSIH